MRLVVDPVRMYPMLCLRAARCSNLLKCRTKTSDLRFELLLSDPLAPLPVRAIYLWSMETRRAPPRHCRRARVYGLTPTAMHDKANPPPFPPPSTSPFIPIISTGISLPGCSRSGTARSQSSGKGKHRQRWVFFRNNFGSQPHHHHHHHLGQRWH